jgi:hypothetical protein
MPYSTIANYPDQLLLGFLRGLGLFDYLPEFGCKLKDLTYMKNDLGDVFDIMRNFDSTNSQLVLQIIDKLASIESRTNEMKGNCMALAEQFSLIVTKIKGYMSDAAYMNSLSANLNRQIDSILRRLTTANDLYNSGDMFEAGEAYGSTFRSAFLFDYK